MSGPEGLSERQAMMDPEVWGVDVLVTPQAGGPLPLMVGIFDREQFTADLLGQPVSSREPLLYLQEADANQFDDDATLTVESIDWTIDDRRPDGEGFVEFKLLRVE